MDSLQSVVPAYLKTFWEHYGIIFKAGLLGFSNLRHGRVKTMVQIWVAIEINIKVHPEHKHGKGEIKIVHGNVTTTFPFLVFHSNGLGFDNEKWTRICGFAVHERLINTSGTLLAGAVCYFSYLQSYCMRNSSTSLFAIALAEIRTRLILRRKADCKQFILY